MTRYGTLRSWAQLLKFLGVLLVVAALFGTIATAIDVEGFWKTLGVIFMKESKRVGRRLFPPRLA